MLLDVASTPIGRRKWLEREVAVVVTVTFEVGDVMIVVEVSENVLCAKRRGWEVVVVTVNVDGSATKVPVAEVTVVEVSGAG